jgi:uncharacterized protein (TIGR03437 family)
MVLGLACAAWTAPKLPVAFEPNRGQAPAGVDYVARVGGGTVNIHSGGVELSSRNTRLKLTFSGARVSLPASEGALPGTVNYLLGRDSSQWLTGIPTWERVRYRDIYRGIDVVYYGKQGQFEYDFVVAPGADPHRIRTFYEGARSLRLNAAGDLLIETSGATLLQPRPRISQGGREIAGGYAINGHSVGFRIGRYDRAQPLLIDPALSWATYFGTASTEDLYGLATDSSGNSYITGWVLSSRGDEDVFVSKLNPAGTATVFTSVLGGTTGDDEGQAITVDVSGNVYVAGQTNSDDFPTVGTSVDLSGFYVDAFLFKLDPTGKNFVFSTYLGGSDDDYAFGIALDSASNIWLTGATASLDFPITRSGAQRTPAGGYDAFLTEFDVTGKLLYSSYLGGSGDDVGYGIAIDSTGNAVITGSTTSTNFPVTGSAYQSTNAGGMDGFVASISGSGVAWATYFGGSRDDSPQGIAADATGIYITGQTASTDFPSLNSAQSSSGGGASDAFVTKFSPDGSSLIYSTYLGGSSAEIGSAISVDASGNAYVGGSTASSNFPVADAFQSALRGPNDGFVTAVAKDGRSWIFSSFLGGSGADAVHALAFNCAAGVIAGGSTASTNFPTTPGVVQPAFAGGQQDGFVAKIAAGNSAAAVSTGGVVNGATFAAGPVSPGSLITIFGTNLAMTTAQVGTTPLPTTLGGASVSINGVAAPIVYASASQLNVQVPYETSPGSAALTVTSCGGQSAPVSFQVAQAAPYIFPNAGGSAIVQNRDGSINSAANPAAANSAVTVYLTGIGSLDNPAPTGAAAPTAPLSSATLGNSATVGDQNAQVLFLGLTPGFVGLAQANIVVPTLTPGSYPITITVGGSASNTPVLYVK